MSKIERDILWQAKGIVAFYYAFSHITSPLPPRTNSEKRKTKTVILIMSRHIIILAPKNRNAIWHITSYYRIASNNLYIIFRRAYD